MRILVLLIVVGWLLFGAVRPANAAERRVILVDGVNGNRFTLTYDDAPSGRNGALNAEGAVWTFEFERGGLRRYAYTIDGLRRLRRQGSGLELQDRRDLRLDGQAIRGRLAGAFNCQSGQAQISLRISNGPARGTYQAIKQPAGNGSLTCT